MFIVLFINNIHCLMLIKTLALSLTPTIQCRQKWYHLAVCFVTPECAIPSSWNMFKRDNWSPSVDSTCKRHYKNGMNNFVVLNSFRNREILSYIHYTVHSLEYNLTQIIIRKSNLICNHDKITIWFHQHIGVVERFMSAFRNNIVCLKYQAEITRWQYSLWLYIDYAIPY